MILSFKMFFKQITVMDEEKQMKKMDLMQENYLICLKAYLRFSKHLSQFVNDNNENDKKRIERGNNYIN